MTTYYLWSGATGAADGTSWVDAYTDLVTALSGKLSGDIIKMHTGVSPHLETASAHTKYIGPTANLPVVVIGVDKDNSDAYAKSTVANLVTTSGYYIETDGSLVFYGIFFDSGNTLRVYAGDNNEIAYYEDCTFNSEAGKYGTSNCRFINCIFDGGIGTSTHVEIIGGVNQGTGGVTSGGNTITIIGMDLSSTSGEVNTVENASIIGCIAPDGGITGSATYRAVAGVYGTDSVAGNNQWETYRNGGKYGSVTVDDAAYRNSGATYDGSTNYSLVLEGSVYNDIHYPVYTEWQTGYLDSTGLKTFTVYVANETADLDNDEVWLEVEYFANTGNTLKKVATTRIANVLTSPATQPEDTVSTWIGITEFAQKLQITVTVNKVGMFRWRAASAITTSIYVDPKIEVV